MSGGKELVLPAEYWDEEWDKEMGEAHYPYGPLVKWAEFYLKDFKGKRVLEVGSGSGAYSTEMAKRGAEVHAVDFSERAITLSQLTANRSGTSIQIYRSDGLALPFQNSAFDLVFSEGFLEHISPDEQERALREQIRVVKPRGFIIVDVPSQYEIRKSCDESLDKLEKSGKIKLRRTYGWSVVHDTRSDILPSQFMQAMMTGAVSVVRGSGFVYQDTRFRIPW